MTMASRKDRKRVLDYLYGGMSEAKTRAFESELQLNAGLVKLLAQERAFDRVVERKPAVEVPAELLEESRQGLHAEMYRRRPGPASWFTQTLFGFPSTQGFLLPAMAAALLFLGFGLGRIDLGSVGLPSLTSAGTISALAPSIASLIGRDDLEVIDLDIGTYDSESGKVSLSFNVAANVTLSADMKDPSVQELMLGAFMGNVEAGDRLDAVDLLNSARSSGTVQQALIYALRNDPNPGVRVKAAEALGDLAGKKDVQDALREALLTDVNPGVRVQAIDVLKRHPNKETLKVLETKAATDANEYVRLEAKRLLDSSQGLEQASE
jgi:hypothetical protein